MKFGFTASYIALWLLVVFQTLVTIGLLRQITTLLSLWEGRLPSDELLPLGSLAPKFSAWDLRSGEHLGSELLAVQLSNSDPMDGLGRVDVQSNAKVAAETWSEEDAK